MTDCIFCKIIAGEIPATKVYQDDAVIAFRDITPAAPTHILIVPREHLLNVNELDETKLVLAGKLLLAAQKIAAGENVAESGYRLVMNNGENGGQSVGHMHMHLLAGRKLAWPPG